MRFMPYTCQTNNLETAKAFRLAYDISFLLEVYIALLPFREMEWFARISGRICRTRTRGKPKSDWQVTTSTTDHPSPVTSFARSHALSFLRTAGPQMAVRLTAGGLLMTIARLAIL